MKITPTTINTLNWAHRQIRAQHYHPQDANRKSCVYRSEWSQRGDHGILHRVHRSPSRAVRTYVFMPFREEDNRHVPLDWHVWLDFCAYEVAGVVKVADPTVLNELSPTTPTHHLTIARLSHLLPLGDYEVTSIYSSYYAFPPDLNGNPHTWAIEMTDNLALEMSAVGPDSILNWYRFCQLHAENSWSKARRTRRKALEKRKNDGFTLTELLIAIVISGILAAIAIPLYRALIVRAREAEGRLGVAHIVKRQQESWVTSRQFLEFVEHSENYYQFSQFTASDWVLVRATPVTDTRLQAFCGLVTGTDTNVKIAWGDCDGTTFNF